MARTPVLDDDDVCHPVKSQPSAAEVVAPAQLAPSFANVKRITVVDDAQDICALVRYRLTTMGMDVDCYFDGKSGLEAILANPPDLAIIDVMMPGINGLDVTRAIRTNDGTRNLPIVIFSALARPEEHQAGLAAGADHYVVKPFSPSALGAFVDRILGLRACTVCGARRGENDVEFSVEQVLQQTQVGWTTTAYGDICGKCHVEAFKKLTW